MIGSNHHSKEILELLRRAGTAILGVASDGFTVTGKADHSPVTEADLLSDAIIRDGMESILPGATILSEEVAGAGVSGGDDFWVLDPIDGTREFIAGNGEYCISLALISRGRPVEGYIHAPVSGETWFALQGEGAWYLASSGAKPLRLPNSKPGKSLVMLTSRSHHSEREEGWLERTRESFRVITKIQGSAIKFGRIAAGDADLYVKMGLIFEWDIAAGDILICESGGRVTTFEGGHPIYYTGGRAPIPWFTACSARAAAIEGLLV